MARKPVEEMIEQYTPEEWQQIIETEMEELGLYFTGEILEEPISLFEEDEEVIIDE